MPLLTMFGVLVCVVFGVQDDEVSLLQGKKQRQSGPAAQELDWFQIRANFGANGYCLTWPDRPLPVHGVTSPLIFEPCGYDGNGQPNNDRQRWRSSSSSGGFVVQFGRYNLDRQFALNNDRGFLDFDTLAAPTMWTHNLGCIGRGHWRCTYTFVQAPCVYGARYWWDWIDPSNHSKQMKFVDQACNKCLDMVDATSDTDWNAAENQQKRAVLRPCEDVPATSNQAFEMKQYCFRGTPSNAHIEGACSATITTTTTTTTTATIAATAPPSHHSHHHGHHSHYHGHYSHHSHRSHHSHSYRGYRTYTG